MAAIEAKLDKDDEAAVQQAAMDKQNVSDNEIPNLGGKPMPELDAALEQAADAAIDAKLDKDDPDAWRKDRRGFWLNPHALYMRFYRSIQKEGN